MREQTILLIFILWALAATLGLYIWKAVKQIKYKGDERWQQIQLKANNTANAANWFLLLLLLVIPYIVDSHTTFTLQRVIIFGDIYIGIRNFAELAAAIYYDRQL